MKDVIAQLVHELVTRSPESYEAALKLMLLVERECVYSPNDDITRDIAAIIGERFVPLRLAPDEVDEIVDTLLRHVASCQTPSAEAVMVLKKSYKAGIVPVLAAVLRAHMADPSQRNLAYDALYVMTAIGVGSEHRELALAAIRDAAAHGVGDVQESAREYLDLYRRIQEEPEEDEGEETDDARIIPSVASSLNR